MKMLWRKPWRPAKAGKKSVKVRQKGNKFRNVRKGLRISFKYALLFLTFCLHKRFLTLNSFEILDILQVFKCIFF